MKNRVRTLRDDIALIIFDRELEHLLKAKFSDTTISEIAVRAWDMADKILDDQDREVDSPPAKVGKCPECGTPAEWTEGQEAETGGLVRCGCCHYVGGVGAFERALGAKR